jgi:hypothetical protein
MLRNSELRDTGDGKDIPYPVNINWLHERHTLALLLHHIEPKSMVCPIKLWLFELEENYAPTGILLLHAGLDPAVTFFFCTYPLSHMISEQDSNWITGLPASS